MAVFLLILQKNICLYILKSIFYLLSLSTHVTAIDYPDMETKLVVSFGVTEIKDWDGTENANSGKLV